MAMDAIWELRRHMEKHEAQGDSSQDPSDEDVNDLLAEIQDGRNAWRSTGMCRPGFPGNQPSPEPAGTEPAGADAVSQGEP